MCRVAQGVVNGGYLDSKMVKLTNSKNDFVPIVRSPHVVEWRQESE
ncbi:MAG: hypothetical protein ACI9MC_003938 [Kiritimatiellia bacterium]|jgi:hypothetical protein